MSLIIVILHIVVCIALIMIVLLQTGKGADMGAAFGGGGSQTLFGSTGASTFLSKATTVVAVLFMVTSLALGYMTGNRTGSSVMPESKAPIAAPVAPAETTDAAAPAADTPAPAAENATENTAAPAAEK